MMAIQYPATTPDAFSFSLVTEPSAKNKITTMPAMSSQPLRLMDQAWQSLIVLS
jgi:hypothetical protein